MRPQPTPWYIVRDIAFRELATAIHYAGLLGGRNPIRITWEA